jgi:dipeptidyl-peptidase-4
MRSLLAAFALCCACAPTDKSAKSTENRPMTNTTTWPALDAKLLADAAATYNFRLGLPAPLAVTPDGAVLFRRTGARDFVADLYELDTRTGAVKKLIDVAALLGTGQENLSDAEKARRERSRTATRGIVDIDVSADGRWVMAALAGDVVMVDRNDGRVANIAVSGDMYDAHLSPDGTKIAFVRGGNLWLMPATGGTPKPLTKRPEGFEYGVADFAAMEELDRRRGWWCGNEQKKTDLNHMVRPDFPSR